MRDAFVLGLVLLAERLGLLLPSSGQNSPPDCFSLRPALHSSSEAGRSHWHSLRSFSIPRMHSTRRRVPADIKCWRTQFQPIRTIGEITAHIKILPTQQPHLYQKLSKKATQLRLLEMSYGQIARSLRIDRKTATKACEHQGR